MTLHLPFLNSLSFGTIIYLFLSYQTITISILLHVPQATPQQIKIHHVLTWIEYTTDKS